MTRAASIAFGLTAVLAVLDWLAVARKYKSFEYLAKPATMVALIGAAIALDPSDDAVRWAFVVALTLSMLGDIFLMLPTDRFIPGVASFGLAHLAYVAGFRMNDTSTSSALIVGAAIVVVYAMAAGRKVLSGVRERAPGFVAPVAAYIAIISVMVASAIATKDAIAIAGAAIFMGSDTVIAWNRFVQPLSWAPVTIMVSYHLGQALLVLSLIRR